MKEHAVNTLNNFICGWYMDPEEISLCSELIFHFKSSNYQQPGSTGSGYNATFKKSTDAPLIYGDLSRKYISGPLQRAVDLYCDKYKYANEYTGWTIKRPVNIQYYKPSDGFYEWHCERSSDNLNSCNRHLTFITYLNNVEDSGETEFYYQDLKIKPEVGLTIIFPCDWTFTHRGIPSQTQEKYIVTGWYEYTGDL